MPPPRTPWELPEHLLAESIDDHVHRVFGGESALLAVEDLVLADLRGRSFVLHPRRGVPHLDVRERVRAACVAQQQGIALGEVPGVHRILLHLHQSAVGVLADPAEIPSRRSCFGVLSDVDHLRAGVGLLTVVRHRHRIELPDRVVAEQQHARDISR